MSHQVNEWEIEVIKRTYSTLELSTEQAELIYLYQQEKDTPSRKHLFSVWEEWEYETSVFQNILTIEQYKKYKAEQKGKIKLYEATLLEEDEYYPKQVNRLEELVKFHEEVLIPSFYKEPGLVSFYNLEQNKIAYLCTEYQSFLNDYKKEILVNHFRHCKNFSPNMLKSNLLSHKLMCLLPDYAFFRYHLDEPTKVIVNYVIDNLSRAYADKDLFVNKKLIELQEFKLQITKKQYGSNGVNGWHVTDPSIETEKKHYRMMMLLLLKRNGYS